MKLLADENFPLASTQYLIGKGIDVRAVGDDFPGISDEEVIKLAEQEGRVIVTFDRDFGFLVFKLGNDPDNGVIYLRLERFKPEEPGKFIEAIISSPDFDPRRKLTVFDGKSIRQRSY